MILIFARRGQANREYQLIRDQYLIAGKTLTRLYHLYAAHQSPEPSPVLLSAYSWITPDGSSVRNLPSTNTTPVESEDAALNLVSTPSLTPEAGLNDGNSPVDFFATVTSFRPQSALPTYTPVISDRVIYVGSLIVDMSAPVVLLQV